MSAGHRGETLTSIKKCSNFKRNHNFLLQVWESLYREMFQSFMEAANDKLSLSSIMSAAKASMLECNCSLSEGASDIKLRHYLQRTDSDFS